MPYIIAPNLSPHQMLERADEVANKCRSRAATLSQAEADQFPVVEFGWVAECGLLAAPLPLEQDGTGLGLIAGTNFALLQLLKEMGRANLAVGRVYEGHVNALQLIQRYGTPQQLEQYAADAVKNHNIFGVWNTEAADGVKIMPLANGKYRLEGSKTFTSGADFIQRPIVPGALPEGGWQMCVVAVDELPIRVDPSFWKPLGMQASVSYKVDFSGVELEPTALIGSPGDYYQQPWFSGGAIRFTAVQLGGAEALFDETRSFLQKMQRIEDPYQKMRLAEMAVAIESGKQWLYGAAQLLDNSAFVGKPASEQDNERLIIYANMTRSAIEEICLKVIQLTQKCVGARGLLSPLPFERLIRDLTMYLRQPNPDGALAEVGRYVLEQTKPSRKLWLVD